MQEILCSNCNKINQADEGLDYIYCQYCGQKIIIKDSSLRISSLIEQALSNKDPIQIHDRLVELDKEYPNNIDIKRALLLQGRLHERSPKRLDFSVIHCYLLNVFLEGEAEKGQKAKFVEELMHGTLLLECLKLAKNRNLFLQEYYVEISQKYIELFLMGSSKYMKQFFGLSFSKNPAKTLAEPAARIIRNILYEQSLNEYRFVLAKAFYTAFGKKFGSDYKYINEYLGDTLNLVLGEYRQLDL